MRVCLDTNVLLQLFGANARFIAIRRALFVGQFEWAISNEVMLEYEEIVTKFSSALLWRQISTRIELLKRLYGNIVLVEPTFRFGVIVTDPDDNKFVDCAIVAAVDFIVTEDRHFRVLAGSGYRPQPITPQEFTRCYLEQE